MEVDDRGAMAAAVWLYALGYASALGAVGAVVTVMSSLATGADARTVITVALIATLAGGAFGFVVGTIVGIALGLLVFFGHRRLGAGVVATLMPPTAVVMTEPITYAIFRGAGTPAAVLMVLLDGLLTLLGAHLIARRYRKLAEVARVH